MIHVLRRFFKRNSLIIFGITLLLTTSFFVGRASADPLPDKPKIEGYQKYEQYIIARPATTTTTTTTTTTRPKPPAVRQVSAMPTGDWIAQCHLWAEQAGIMLPDAAIKLIGRESSCNPSAQNPTSSACGIAQNIRGCDSAGYGHDPLTQLIWMRDYIVGRYGSWDSALNHSYSKGWY